jgi:amino acid adenylation domain-containing protein
MYSNKNKEIILAQAIANAPQSILIGKNFKYQRDNITNNILSVYELILIQSKKSPENIAIEYNKLQLTYKQLIENVELVSSNLLSQGVRKGDHVFCYGHRNNEFFITMLALFKIGAIYTPIDPFVSFEKIEEMLTMVPRVFVVIHKLHVTKEQLEKINSICSNNLNFSKLKYENLCLHSSVKKDIIVNIRDAAYCIFTSGTTGKPKGVLVHHLGMLNHNLAKVKDLKITENDIIAQSTTQTFDVHIWQIIAPLLVGAKIIIIDRCIADSPEEVINIINNKGITIFELVPSIFGLLLSHIRYRNNNKELPNFLSLRYLITTGEQLPPSYCKEWLNLYRIPIINAFGPTECSDDVCHMIIDVPPDSNVIHMPIGKLPIQNTRFYILDENLEPTTSEKEGLLYIAGDCVGLGYLNSEQNKESFMSDIYFKNELMYSTKDRVKFVDGNIIYLGRAGGFVKISGQRVETEEFSAAVMKHPSVLQAVTQQEEIDNSFQVVCYVQLQPNYIQKIHKEKSGSHVEKIAQIFDQTVIKDKDKFVNEFNHSGWNNYNKKPFSFRAVKENLDDALFHLESSVKKDHTVLEIGCGTGMLAVRVASLCKHYTGIDISSQSIEIAKSTCLAKNIKNTSFKVCPADKLISSFYGKKYNIIFLNAVVNYLQSSDELVEIIDQASKLLVKPGGVIYLFDVYDLCSKHAMHAQFTYINILQDEKNITVSHLESLIKQRIKQDPDLWLKPTFFKNIVKKKSTLKSISAFLKKGHKYDDGAPNPMVRYRYGVKLSTEPNEEFPGFVYNLIWGIDVNCILDLKKFLIEKKPDGVKISLIPNDRVLDVFLIMKCISENKNKTISELSKNVENYLSSKNYFSTSIDPDALQKQIEDLGYRVDNLMFSNKEGGKYISCYFDATIVKDTIKQKLFIEIPLEQENFSSLTSLASLKIENNLLPELYETLNRNTQYGKYAVLIIVPEIPKTINGKIDSSKLSQYYFEMPFENRVLFRDAKTKVEKIVSQIWQDTFNFKVVEPINSDQDFGLLGVPSITLVEILSKINQKFHVSIQIRDIKNYNTLNKISAFITDSSKVNLDNFS